MSQRFDNPAKINSHNWSVLMNMYAHEDFEKYQNSDNPSDDSLPPASLRFRALELTPHDKVKVVILGQDPYHTPGKAIGLAFGIPQDWPEHGSSFGNIIQEVHKDTGETVRDFTLESWAKQGVLLLNTRLSVEPYKPMSHANKYGWEHLTRAVMKTLNTFDEPIVFLLWGAEAKRLAPLITARHHKVLTASHPCRYSAHISFIGCGHFSKANEYLEKRRRGRIRWGA